MTFIGNTAGLSQLPNTNQAGTLGSIGAFTSLNTALQVPTFPAGTTLNYLQNGSAANLTLPIGSTVIYAELIWGGNYYYNYVDTANPPPVSQNIFSVLSNPVLFNGQPVLPDPATAQEQTFSQTSGTLTITRGFYERSADVTAIVQAAGAGSYTCQQIPGLVEPVQNYTGATNHAGWTLAVMYRDLSLPERTLYLYNGAQLIINTIAPTIDIPIAGFATKPSGPINARLLVSAQEGDADIPNDFIQFGPTAATLTQLSGPNNPINNFFGSQINNSAGVLATSGTFGTRNQNPFTQTNIVGGRQGWDITNLDVSSYMQNNIPTIAYNIEVQRNTGHGPSMLITDVKGQLYRTTAPLAKEAGYRPLVLNFRDVMSGVWFNLMYKVNRCMDSYKAATDPMQQAISYGMAERYAKVCAASLVDNMGDANSKSSASDYFDETAKGLITGLILLVSEYGAPNERHLISVFNLVIELNGQQPGQGGIKEQMNQKSRLAIMMEDIDNERIKRYVGAAMSADSRTSMNVFSSALGKLTKFIDAELEQMICQHSPELADLEFLDQPTIIYIVCPDENTTRHFLAALFIRFFANDLIETAESKYNGVLPRKVLFMLDEFGNMPVIQDVDVLFAAIRSRGVRIMIALQSYSQLYKSYSREKAEIIKDTCQMVMFTFCSPSSQQTAESLSKMLGNETVLTGSVSYNQGRATSTNSMVGKPLISPAEMVIIPWGTWVVMKAGRKPFKTHLSPYQELLQLPEGEPEAESKPFTTVVVSNTKTIVGRVKDKEVYLQKGMFD
ncbi:type IV secretory system conjugative DNA transfer family protein [Pygmaiobacter massiliensis]|uniref:type IV secretory system conjugative DNA transfer family protein n=1 Tax=Pygmaiobacter massiliensis TaxID=1917873 RepID=UPI0028970611|nr:type IV secretory system conjugative DNA transfer family protein [Pygmaiobacter massiliensis]